jgi:hypothetical protein
VVERRSLKNENEMEMNLEEDELFLDLRFWEKNEN